MISGPVFALLAGSASMLAATLAATMVFFFDRFPRKILDTMIGVASGIMLAACFTIYKESQALAVVDGVAFPLVVSVGLLIGMGALYLLDKFVMHRFPNLDHHTPASITPEPSANGGDLTEVSLTSLPDTSPDGNDPSSLTESLAHPPQAMTPKKRQTAFLLLAAMMLHTIPEGLALGLICAAATTPISGPASASSSGSEVDVEERTLPLHTAVGLILGVAVHNIPEGAAVAVPLRSCGMSKRLTFLLVLLSAAIRPIGAIVGAVLVVPFIVPFGLMTACGAMLYVVVDELIPLSHEAAGKHAATVGNSLGFVLMLMLVTGIDYFWESLSQPVSALSVDGEFK